MKRLNFLILIIYPFALFAQPTLLLNEAIDVALEKNYSIQISELEQAAEEMSVYKSNAGFGPVVDWIASYNMTGNNVNQQFIDGREVNRYGRSFSPNTFVTVGITLLDGGRMRATYDRLGLMNDYAMLQGKLIIQNTMVDVMQNYFEIFRHKQTVFYLETIIEYYEERLKITEERWKVGRGSKLDFLQSQTDMNAQLSQMVTANNNLRNAKVTLNGILNRDLAIDFDIEEVESFPTGYELDELTKTAKEQNRELLLIQKSIDISRKQEQEISALKAPQVSFDGRAGYSYNNTNAGFLLSNQSISATVGVSASWNLFDGHHRKNQIAISKINTQIVEGQMADLESQILTDLTFAYNQFVSDKELLEFEELNKVIAEENLSISIEKFRLGGSSILELSEAQRSYNTALNRLVNAQYNTKISELNLLRLSGTLVR